MANWWDKNLTDKQKFRLQEPKDPSLLDVVSTVPNPVGDVASGLLAAQDFSKGNYGSAALNALGLLPFVPSMAGTFIGKGSKMWDALKAEEAVNLEKAKVAPENIWAQTGTVRGADGKLRQEISDVPAKFNTAQDLIEKAKAVQLENENLKTLIVPVKNQKDLFPKQLTEARRPIKEKIQQNINLLDKNYGLREDPFRGNYANLVFEHPELYQSYPDMERIVISQGWNKGEGNFGSYIPSKNFMSDNLQINRAALERNTKGVPEWGGKSTTLHELQHGIQEREGFAGGGSTDEFVRQLLDEKYQLNDQVKQLNEKMSSLAKADKMSPQAQSAYDMLMEQRMQIVPRIQQLQDDQYIGKEAYRLYKNLGGEAESRLTQARMNLTPEQRLKYFPYAQGEYGLDVPFNELIVRGLLE
jgi:hypothetical protein